jgi:hypothetical protein
MTLDALFTLANASVMPAWLLLAVAPRSVWTRRIAHSLLYPAVLGSLYSVYAVTSFLGSATPEGASFNSLPGVVALFAVPQLAFIGWVHYLVFDLFVGAWEARDARRRGIPHALLLPCLFFTLMLGPLGLLLYLAIRFAMLQQTGLVEDESATH